jgi:hypothetical protein
MEPRSFKRLLVDSGRLLLDTPGLYLALIAAGMVPALLLALFVPASASKEAFNAAWNAGDMGSVTAVAFGSLATRVLDSFLGVAAILALAARDEGRSPDLPGSLSEAARRFWPYLTTGLLALVFILGGTVLFIIPGLILALRYSLIPYAVLVEGREGRAALDRSSALCRARPAKIYGSLLGGALAIVIAAGAATLVSGLVTVFLPAAADQVVAKAVDGAAGLWLAGFAVLLYKDVAKVVE